MKYHLFLVFLALVLLSAFPSQQIEFIVPKEPQVGDYVYYNYIISTIDCNGTEYVSKMSDKTLYRVYSANDTGYDYTTYSATTFNIWVSNTSESLDYIHLGLILQDSDGDGYYEGDLLFPYVDCNTIFTLTNWTGHLDSLNSTLKQFIENGTFDTWELKKESMDDGMRIIAEFSLKVEMDCNYDGEETNGTFSFYLSVEISNSGRVLRKYTKERFQCADGTIEHILISDRNKNSELEPFSLPDITGSSDRWYEWGYVKFHCSDIDIESKVLFDMKIDVLKVNQTEKLVDYRIFLPLYGIGYYYTTGNFSEYGYTIYFSDSNNNGVFDDGSITLMLYDGYLVEPNWTLVYTMLNESLDEYRNNFTYLSLEQPASGKFVLHATLPYELIVDPTHAWNLTREWEITTEYTSEGIIDHLVLDDNCVVGTESILEVHMEFSKTPPTVPHPSPPLFEAIYQFLVQYWLYILIALFAIIAILIILIVRKKHQEVPQGETI